MSDEPVLDPSKIGVGGYGLRDAKGRLLKTALKVQPGPAWDEEILPDGTRQKRKDEPKRRR